MIYLVALVCSHIVPGVVVPCRAQAPPDTVWQRFYSGQDWDYVNTAVQTADGGFLLACATGTKGRTTRNGHGGSDIWMVRTDSMGVVLWQKNYGGSRDDRVVTVVQGTGGGFVFAGMTQSADGDIPRGKYHGRGDAWVVKIDDTGKILWQQVLGGSALDCANSVIVTPDSGYLMTGYTASHDGDLSSNAGKTDVWMVKMNKGGKPLWSKTCGGSDDDLGSRAINATGGGFLVVCHTKSSNPPVTDYHGGGDLWLLRIGADGGLMWQKTLGGSGYDFASAVSPTPDGGYMICGISRSPEITGHKGSGEPGIWVVKTDFGGEVQWQKTFAGTGKTIVRTAHALPDGNYLFTGNGNKSSVGLGQSEAAPTDGEMLCFSASGDLMWEKSFGATGGNDSCNYSMLTTDGGLLCTGSGYVPAGRSAPGARAGWVFKTAPVYDAGAFTGSIAKYSNAIKVYPTPTTGIVNIVLPDALLGAALFVCDMAGKKLDLSVNRTGTRLSISLAGHPLGLYILNISSGEGSGRYKIELR